MSGLKPYFSPSQLMDPSFDLDTLTEDKLVFEEESMIEEWESGRRSPKSDSSVWSSTAWRGLARSADTKHINSAYVNVDNIIVREILL